MVNQKKQTASAVASKPFSTELEVWLKDKDQKTINDLENVFQDRSFAIMILIFMALPALPIPTGGISHIFEIIAVTIAAQMIFGKEKLWLPQKWRKKEISDRTQKAMIVPLLKFIRFFEKFSRPRLAVVLRTKLATSLTGLVIVGFTLAAFVSPPFSGLDTLPAMGVVILCLSVILKDILLVAIGTIVGSVGVALIISAGFAITKVVDHII